MKRKSQINSNLGSELLPSDLHKSFYDDSNAVSSACDNSTVEKHSVDIEKATYVEISQIPAADLVDRESKMRKGATNQKDLYNRRKRKLSCEESAVVDKSETTVEFPGLFLKSGAGPQSEEDDLNGVVSDHSDLSHLEIGEEGALVERNSDYFYDEKFSGDYDHGYSSLLLSDYVPDNWELYVPDFADSWDNDSGSQLSEKSNHSYSPTFQLFLQYSRELCRSYFDSTSNCSFSLPEDHDFQMMKLRGLDHKDDLESCKMVKTRKRRAIDPIKQRIKIVLWIHVQFQYKELHRQTAFLGISLLDRFVSKCYFKTKRSLQILGVACLNLAMRIEENQPFHGIQERIFHLGNNTYSRCEVVAMEWLVEEVLKFENLPRDFIRYTPPPHCRSCTSIMVMRDRYGVYMAADSRETSILEGKTKSACEEREKVVEVEPGIYMAGTGKCEVIDDIIEAFKKFQDKDDTKGKRKHDGKAKKIEPTVERLRHDISEFCRKKGLDLTREENQVDFGVIIITEDGSTDIHSLLSTPDGLVINERRYTVGTGEHKKEFFFLGSGTLWMRQYVNDNKNVKLGNDKDARLAYCKDGIQFAANKEKKYSWG